MSEGNNGTGITMKIPLEQWVKEIVRETAWEVVKEALPQHVQACAAVQLVPQIMKNTESIMGLRLNWRLLIGLMLGSGTLGGGAFAVLSKLI